MTQAQIYRAWRKLWEHVTRGDGYQPFGYDRVTMNAIHPGYYPALTRLREEYQKIVNNPGDEWGMVK